MIELGFKIWSVCRRRNCFFPDEGSIRWNCWQLVVPQLHMLRVSPSMGQVLEMNTTLRHLLFLLEYCMVTGYDWWDVLLHVQPTMVHNLVEKLHEEYMRQNQALQQVSKASHINCFYVKLTHSSDIYTFSSCTSRFSSFSILTIPPLTFSCKHTTAVQLCYTKLILM